MVNEFDFFYEIMRDFLHRIDKGEEQIANVYQTYKRLLDSQLQKESGQAEQIAKRYEILDKVYKLFSDETIRMKIAESGITAKEFREMLEQGLSKSEEKEDENQRTYEVTDLFDESFISSHQVGQKVEKKLNYSRDVRKVDGPFFDKDKRAVFIQKIGVLKYTNVFGVEKAISRYRIVRFGEKNLEQDERFSSDYIDVEKMQEPGYREVVLEELLGENNMQHSKESGYIGHIIKAENTTLEVGEAQKTSSDYTYRINEQYCIEYDAEDLSAAMLYKEKEKNEKDKNEDLLQTIMNEFQGKRGKDEWQR